MRISIIIPCYNTGIYLNEAIQSVINNIKINYEIIVVNDGSDDVETLRILSEINFQKVTVVNQVNKGLAAARNFGVKNSKGEFILFLDSDNKIKKGYFEKAIQYFNEDNKIGVVYSKPIFFGDSSESRFFTQPYNFNALLAGNYIDACSFVRRTCFIEVNGFDEDRKLIISEDWDLWIRISLLKWKFYYINEELFEYRIRKDSMIGKVDANKIKITQRYIGEKYGFIFHQKYRQYYRVLEKIEKSPFKFFIKILINKYIRKKSFIE